MGWLKLGFREKTAICASSPLKEDLKAVTEHIETVAISPCLERPYPFASLATSNSDLPFISPAVVAKHQSALTGGLYIVVNNIVFDCTEFVTRHPGGDQIIQSFAGSECSWQFWRFHGEKEMQEHGRQLRVGRTEGMVNRYAEPVRYVGLRRFGADEWD